MKDIPGYEGRYAVTIDGKVWSYPKLNGGKHPGMTKGKWLKLVIIRGWPHVCLGASNRKQVHRLVAETFIPKIAGKNDVNHKNGIKTDNRIENLEWCTRGENAIHALNTGLRKKNKKLYSGEIVSKIRQMRKNGFLLKDIQNKYNLSNGMVWRILHDMNY